jgi:diguanylate cyclase (GGDEF)-like protein
MQSVRSFVLSATRRFSKALSDDAYDDGLLRHLVGTTCLQPAAILLSGIVGGVVCGFVSFMSSEPLFAGYAVAHVLLAAYRVRIGRVSLTRIAAVRTRSEILAVERLQWPWSIALALLLGATNYSLLSRPETEGLAPMALGLSVGFSLAFVARSAGRLKLFALQLFALDAPVVIGFTTGALANGGMLAALFVVMLGVVIIPLAVGQNVQIIELYRTNEENRILARTDALTGLLNRTAFSEALKAALRSSAANGAEGLVLLAADLDRFKEINDLLGHDVGDAVIVQTGERLCAAVGRSAVVARIGGDEFLVLAPAGHNPEATARDLAERVVEAMEPPYMFDGAALPVTASVGVALCPHHAESAEDLLKKADVALYEAKRAGRNMARLFEPDMLGRVHKTRALEIEMHRAIKRGEFETWFQPIQDLLTGRPDRFEALARWRHPERGLIGPDEFIPLAEQIGSIATIGAQIIDQACRAAMQWPERLSVCVKLYPAQFRDPPALVGTMRSALERSGLPAARLELEFDESVLIAESPAVRLALQEILALGVVFVLGNLGVGYASLAYLQEHAFARLKIDRRFVRNIETDETSAAIVASISVMAGRLGMDAVAEGVDTPAQEAVLRRLGVRRAQGGLYGEPVAISLEASAITCTPDCAKRRLVRGAR